MSNKRRTHGVTSWANIPEDILGLILNHLPYIDHIRVGAVCGSWYATVGKKLYHAAQQIPWLMLLGNLESESCIFYSLSDNKVRTLNLPEFRGMRCIGSSDGWLVTPNESGDISLWNPFSRAKIQLPSLKQFPSVLNWRQRSYQFVVPMVKDKGLAENVCVNLPPKFQYLIDRVPFPKDACIKCKQKHVCVSFIRKVVMSTQPGNCAVMIIHGQQEKLAFCRPGDDSWTALALRVQKVHQDIVFYKGRFYVVSFMGYVIAWDVFSTSPMATEIRLRMPPAQYERKYLAELAGDLLLVVRYYEKSRDVCDEYGKWITKTTGDDSWTALAPRVQKVHQDIIFYKGRFYVVSFMGYVIAWDVFSTSTATEIRLCMPPAQYERKYLAELAGDLLLVVRYYEKSRDVCDEYGKWITKTTGFEVFKLNQSGSMWTQLTSLGDHALFVGGNQSISCSARNFSNCKANCIYFCDDAWDVCFEESPPWGHDLGIFNLKDGSFDRYYGIES